MYNFVDVNEQPGVAALPAEAVKIDGVFIEDKISGYRTLSVSGRELIGSEITEKQIGNRSGSEYSSKRTPTRDITVKYLMQCDNPEDFRDKFNILSGILSKEQVRFIFNDELDKYFIGTVSDIGDVEEGRLNVTGEYIIHCTDPFKHSLVENVSINNGESTITLTNSGTETTPINVKAKMLSDNGYLGLVLGDRFYQVGNPGEVDGVIKEKSVKLFDDHFTQDRGWILNSGVTPVVTPERLQVGAVGYTVESAPTGEGFVKATDYGTGNSWHGPALTKIIPADENGEYPTNWRCEYRFDFNTDPGGPTAGKQIGHSSVTFSDENDDIICSVVFEDNNPVMERSDMAVYIENKRVWDTRETQKFYVTGRGSSGPAVTVEKIGNTVTIGFTYGGIKKTFFLSNPSATLRKVTWYCAAYKNYTPIQNNNIRALNVRKHNVQYYEDIPNFLSDGDVVELNSSSNELYINDIKDWDRVDIGSKPLLLPPGQHTLGIAVSDFAEIPEVEVTYRERWL